MPTELHFTEGNISTLVIGSAWQITGEKTKSSLHKYSINKVKIVMLCIQANLIYTVFK